MRRNTLKRTIQLSGLGAMILSTGMCQIESDRLNQPNEARAVHYLESLAGQIDFSELESGDLTREYQAITSKSHELRQKPYVHEQLKERDYHKAGMIGYFIAAITSAATILFAGDIARYLKKD